MDVRHPQHPAHHGCHSQTLSPGIVQFLSPSCPSSKGQGWRLHTHKHTHHTYTSHTTHTTQTDHTTHTPHTHKYTNLPHIHTPQHTYTPLTHTSHTNHNTHDTTHTTAYTHILHTHHITHTHTTRVSLFIYWLTLDLSLVLTVWVCCSVPNSLPIPGSPP